MILQGWRRKILVLALLLFIVLVLVVVDIYCYSITLPVELRFQGGSGTLQVGNTTLDLKEIGTPVELQFPSIDPLLHEYQIDGTDSTNNFTLDESYLQSIEQSPYYRFQSWMRNLDGTSRWRDLRIWSGTRLMAELGTPSGEARFALPDSTTSDIRIQLQLQRPETPRVFSVLLENGTLLDITVNRNDRFIKVTHAPAGPDGNDVVAQAFFPVDVAPFAAMIVDTVVRTLLWTIVVLVVTIIGIELIRFAKDHTRERPGGRDVVAPLLRRFERLLHKRGSEMTKPGRNWLPLSRLREKVRRWPLHPAVFGALAASLIFVSWIAAVQYRGQPHIFDGSAYFFAAKMYAQGHLWVPVPPGIERFPGPFMLVHEGRWFGQYPPGTALALVPGIWLGVPWLIEPVLGTLALLGVGLIAAQLFDRRVANLAVLLGVLSPFYSYLAASYLSHTVALFFLVWGWWGLLRFVRGKRWWNLVLAAFCFGMMGLTRDQVAILFVVLLIPGSIIIYRSRQRKLWPRWFTYGPLFLSIAIVFIAISLLFNQALTGSAVLTPRQLFFAGDRWGFGEVGFYGQHTLAAGLVNLDQQLTILGIDLFGWPLYLSFVFILMPFLTLRARRIDYVLLAIATIMTTAYVGYFYHGIYLGPRYLFETLPFLLILSARGILILAEVAGERRFFAGAVTLLTKQDDKQLPIERQATGGISTGGVVVGALVTLLIACNLVYFLPRQIQAHQNFTGLPSSYTIQTDSIYNNNLHRAIVVSDDYYIYAFVLFPLNDPQLQGDVIYAYAGKDEEYAQLLLDYPDRTIYRLAIDTNGKATYKKLDP